MKKRLFIIALLFLCAAAHVAGEGLPSRYAYIAGAGAAVNNNAKHTKLTVFRPSEVDRRSAFKPSSRFWFFLRRQKEQKNTNAYEYDANGNLIYVNTAREKKDGTKANKNGKRKLIWDEENRLEAIDDNGYVFNYWYEAAGERAVNTSSESEQMYVNGLFSGGRMSTANFTAYVSPYMVVSKGDNYTKHIKYTNDALTNFK